MEVAWGHSAGRPLVCMTYFSVCTCVLLTVRFPDGLFFAYFSFFCYFYFFFYESFFILRYIRVLYCVVLLFVHLLVLSWDSCLLHRHFERPDKKPDALYQSNLRPLRCSNRIDELEAQITDRLRDLRANQVAEFLADADARGRSGQTVMIAMEWSLIHANRTLSTDPSSTDDSIIFRLRHRRRFEVGLGCGR